MTTLVTTFVFLFSYWLKTMEREKVREMITTSCEYERESCSKVVGCTNIIFILTKLE